MTTEFMILKELKKIRRIVDWVGSIIIVTIAVIGYIIAATVTEIKAEYLETRNIILSTYGEVRSDIKCERDHLYQTIQDLQEIEDKEIELRRERGRYIISVRKISKEKEER